MHYHSDKELTSPCIHCSRRHHEGPWAFLFAASQTYMSHFHASVAMWTNQREINESFSERLGIAQILTSGPTTHSKKNLPCRQQLHPCTHPQSQNVAHRLLCIHLFCRVQCTEHFEWIRWQPVAAEGSHLPEFSAR